MKFFQCAKLLLAIGPATIFPEVRRQRQDVYRSRLGYLLTGEFTALEEGARLRPLVAATRHVRAVASSLLGYIIYF